MHSVLRVSVLGLLTLSSASCEPAEMRWLFAERKPRTYSCTCKIRCPDGMTRELKPASASYDSPSIECCTLIECRAGAARMKVCMVSARCDQCTPWRWSEEGNSWQSQCRLTCPDGATHSVLAQKAGLGFPPTGEPDCSFVYDAESYCASSVKCDSGPWTRVP